MWLFLDDGLYPLERIVTIENMGDLEFGLGGRIGHPFGGEWIMGDCAF